MGSGSCIIYTSIGIYTDIVAHWIFRSGDIFMVTFGMFFPEMSIKELHIWDVASKLVNPMFVMDKLMSSK